MWNNLGKICDAAAPSGWESAVTELASELMKPLVREVKTDALGNLFGFLPCGIAGAPTVALDAHLDEVGVMISGHKDGYARLQNIGGIDARIMPAHGIRLMNGLRGVVAALPPHVVNAEDADKSIPFNELFLDLGLSASDAEKLAPVGTVGVFDTKFVDRGSTAIGKTLDDRAGFLMILRALELVKDKSLTCNIAICGAVQEETGGDGAVTSAFGQAPDFCVAVDVTHAVTPDAPSHNTFKAGGGPCIGVGPVCDRKLSEKLIKIAKDSEIPYQIEVMGGRTGTDADDYQISRAGVPTAMISIPLKYMHTPSEVLNREDFENSAKLLAEFLCKGVDLAC
ncbi:endoglucanase [Clostridia bacterium]|nr:endoglucanase [Clostridia bacterium]